jgi:capsular exopolysaccharide synthesis family protein
VEPIRYLRALRRRWLVIVASVVVAMIAGWATTAVSHPAVEPSGASYSATTVLWYPPLPTGGQGTPITTMDTLAQIVVLPDVAAIAAQRLDYDGQPIDLSEGVNATADKASDFLRVTAFSGDPDDAVAVSTAFSQALITYLNTLKNREIDDREALVQQQISELQQGGADASVIAPYEETLATLGVQRTTPITLSVLQQAIPEEIPAAGFQAPRSRAARALIAAILGLFAGIALALVLERFDTRIRNREGAEESFGMPVLAEIPSIAPGRRAGVVMVTHPLSRAADAFRLLCVGITFQNAHPSTAVNGNGNGNGKRSPSMPPKTILVTSATPREGKSTVAANLAAAYAEVGYRVMVVSCDLRRPTIHRLFGVEDRPGLTEALDHPSETIDEGEVASSLRPYVRRPSSVKVAVVPSGATPDRPGELLGSPRMQRFLERVSEIADVVILDGAPLLVASDVVPLLPAMEAVLLVARAGKTSSEVAERASNLLARMGAKTVGVVLNDARESSIGMADRRFYRSERPDGRSEPRLRPLDAKAQRV